ncbi:HAD family hydrolase [Streptomyces clavuligerus]|uniref:Hydrolase n=1 Tax=Streptomyces clavuligerus TaxID=1901 RepID=B5H2H0_STRCL|nr:HAD family hydrolase [Streptomyces clavuligerus]ANW19728.1 hydrolase [Streptomyces clavuligerus]AXU14341.1 HAD family hydrolase [Streptomyces clavuligerus]EDY52766.1 hydrolase [Streptomyces clavuligerus]EFG07430.1 Hydrolase [Streptomyces clavuligerus]MBY6304344.1 HAD family hydrolase [Streptomyces clavuligerus]
MRHDLVIFDNDGVLVESERIANAILADWLTELGHPTTLEDSIRDYMGAAVHRVHDLIMERSGRRLPADFDATLHARTVAAFERELEPVEGVTDVLERLTAGGVPFCLASSGTHERIRAGHRRTGLDRWFPEEIVFSAQDVGRGKPAPDLFLHAAQRMGVAPERCVVVEDSALGVAAAVAAGMTVYGFTAMTSAERLAGADAHFGSMTELPALLF